MNTEQIKPSTACNRVKAVKYFSEYLALNYPEIIEAQIDRSVIINYLQYLKQKIPNPATRNNFISQLEQFFLANELSAEFNSSRWLDIPVRLIYPSDYPKYTRESPPDSVISDFVMQQLLEHINELPPYQRRMLIVLANRGLRAGELVELPFDCLIQNGSGGWLLRYRQEKVDEFIIKPFAAIFHKVEEVIEAIHSQQQWVREQWGEDCPYLFPSPRSRNGEFKPVVPHGIKQNLKKLVCRHNIRDEQGKIPNIHLHKYRHTVISKLANSDEVGLFGAQAFIGHKSIQMTLRYWKQDAFKLQKKIEEFNANNQVITSFGEVIDLIKDSRFQIYWQYIVEGNLLEAQLTDSGGICTLPRTLSPCVKNHMCLDCYHHILIPEFLPIHIDHYKTALIRRKFAEGKASSRVLEQYDYEVRKYETIITKLGGDIAKIQSEIDTSSQGVAFLLVQIKQLMLKIGIPTFDDFKKIINALQDVPDAAEVET
ncbi:tyrosine-type recombinase/integrase [Scytonema hofmannii]|uniref:tyrosine-type recombinase/integrase n=1 Tax=Scytonema hofmannii TaxID=34078 RepID=UPI00131406AA|nr:tyrosine-type recombinase/integrase [Scytonema hofmannii]